MLKSSKAFTLAETLIVIGVIGIVSALTLPNLNSSTGDKEIVTKVKKIYQNLNDAYGRAVAVYGPYDEWFVNDGNDSAAKAKRAGERITEFMKIQKDCAMEANKGCAHVGADAATTTYKIISTDGMSIVFSYSSQKINISADIDGPTKGNRSQGKDNFAFIIESDDVGIVPMGFNESFSDILTECKNGGRRAYSTEWIIRFDNADYLKIDRDGKCPNGTTPTESNPRCK